MNIGIIIYSNTGNTQYVAIKLQEKLIAAGHSADIERIIPLGSVHPRVKNLQLRISPGVKSYDAVVFGAPVMAFSLCPAMTVYLSQLESLETKKVAFLLTKFLPFYQTGANQAVEIMNRVCETKGAEVLGFGVVFWSSLRREQHIIDVVSGLSRLF